MEILAQMFLIPKEWCAALLPMWNCFILVIIVLLLQHRRESWILRAYSDSKAGTNVETKRYELAVNSLGVWPILIEIWAHWQIIRYSTHVKLLINANI